MIESVESPCAELDLIRRQIVPWFLCFAAVFLCFAFVPLSIKGKAQLCAVPAVLFLAARIRVFEVRVPRAVLLVAALGTAVGALVQFSHVSLASGAFVVSTVSDEDLRQESKIYRDRLRRNVVAEGESLVGLYHGVIRDAAGAKRVVERNRSLAGVIWGSPRWMSVALRQYEPVALSSFSADSVAQDLLTARGVPDLLLVRSLPFVGMSHGHESGTISFLAQIVSAWRLVPEMTSVGASSGDFEGRLEALSRMQVRWTSRSHVALPLWLSGTVHLIRAVESPTLQSGELECALNSFRDGLKLFRTHDNPALEMAVRNNYAVALLVQAGREGDSPKTLKKALRQFASAMKLRKLDPQMGSVVARNYIGLMQTRKRRAAHGIR